jgi:hypothetical protein
MNQNKKSNTPLEELVAVPLTKNLFCMLPEDQAYFLYVAWSADRAHALAYDFEEKKLNKCRIWRG